MLDDILIPSAIRIKYSPSCGGTKAAAAGFIMDMLDSGKNECICERQAGNAGLMLMVTLQLAIGAQQTPAGDKPAAAKTSSVSRHLATCEVVAQYALRA